MTTKNPRINVVLEKPVYNAVSKLSRKYKISMSMVIRDMVKEEIENFEDIYLGEIATEREKTLKRNQILTHKEFWKKIK
jgi:predicted DNA-binding protein